MITNHPFFIEEKMAAGNTFCIFCNVEVDVITTCLESKCVLSIPVAMEMMRFKFLFI